MGKRSQDAPGKREGTEHLTHGGSYAWRMGCRCGGCRAWKRGAQADWRERVRATRRRHDMARERRGGGSPGEIGGKTR